MFIQMHKENDNIIVMNTDYIVRFWKTENAGTEMELADGEFLKVKETPVEILRTMDYIEGRK